MESPFSFHCMICFEEFDVEVRFPVVMPCGHTYVCNECANRLDKCSECRTPLIELIPQPDSGPEPLPGWSTRSLGASSNARSRRPEPPKKRLLKRRIPLPKNVVLMSLIEATELATQNVQGRDHQPSLHDSPKIKPSVLDVEEDEEEKIKTGTSLAISDCGTYAVAAKDGLEIFPNRPESLVHYSEEDVDTLVRFYNREGDSKELPAEGEFRRRENPPVRLSWGDRVQIVSTQNGWAKMARGYGYVRAGGQSLVKVGGSVDRSCKLEAMLRLMSLRRKELREEQKKIDNQFITYMNELQVSLMSDEDLTVIAADTFHKNLENNDPSTGNSNASGVRTRSADVAPLDSNAPEPSVVSEPLREEDSTPLKPRFNERPMTPPGASSRGSFFCSTTDVLNAFVPLASAGNPSQPPSLPSVNRSPAIAREYSNMTHQQRSHFQQQQHAYPQTPRQSRRSNSFVEDTPTRILTSATHPSPSALRAGARAWREMHGRPASNGIDFRTGMSGHSALFSSSAHPHDYLASTHRFFAGMSNHTGLTMWKAPKFPFGLTSPNTTDDEPRSQDSPSSQGSEGGRRSH